jgi:hypothetical protein
MIKLLLALRYQPTAVTPDGKSSIISEKIQVEEEIYYREIDKKIKNIFSTISGLFSAFIVYFVFYSCTDCFISVKGYDRFSLDVFGEKKSYRELNAMISLAVSFFGFLIGWSSAKMKIAEIDKKIALADR